MKVIQVVFLWLITSLLYFLLLNINTEEDVSSEIDNRKLVPLEAGINAYLRDRIGFRDEMISLNIWLNDKIYGELVHPIYEYGENGYVFFRMTDSRVDTSFLNAFCQYLSSVQQYCEERGSDFIYCINPSKTSIYTEFLPKGYRFDDNFHRKLIGLLDKYDVNYVDNVSFLRYIADSVPIFNKKFDAGHWNDIGAWYGTNHMLRHIARMGYSVDEFERQDFVWDSVVEESLPVSRFIINETVPELSLVDDTVLSERSKYEGLHLHKNHQFFQAYSTSDTASPDVLFFHGSYYNSRNKFYKDRFHSVKGVHNYQNFINFDYYYNIFQPDLVILETAEYATSSSYFDKDMLVSKRLNTVYDSCCDLPHRVLSSKEIDSLAIVSSGSLVDVSFHIEDTISYGFLLSNGQEYDLQCIGDHASTSLMKENFDSTSFQIVLFFD